MQNPQVEPTIRSKMLARKSRGDVRGLNFPIFCTFLGTAQVFGDWGMTSRGPFQCSKKQLQCELQGPRTAELIEGIERTVPKKSNDGGPGLHPVGTKGGAVNALGLKAFPPG